MSYLGPGPLVIGHRGASGYRPEHTASAYRLAFELGADAVEPDIVPTRDGVLVVRHENEISGTTDVAEHPEFADRRTTKVIDGTSQTGWFTEDFTWEELQTLRCVERLGAIRPDSAAHDGEEPILRLVDVLRIIDEQSERLGRALSVVVEVKHAAFFTELGYDVERLCAETLQAAGWADRPEQLVIECFELGSLLRLQALGVPASYVFLLEHSGAPADEGTRVAAGDWEARDYAWYRSDAGLDYLAGVVDGVSPDKASLISVDEHGLATGPTDLVQRAHERGLRVFTWTLRPENKFLNPRFRASADKAEWGSWEAEFALIMRAGVDGVFVDHTNLGISARHAVFGGAVQR